MNLVNLRKLLVLINLRLLVSKDSVLIGIRKEVKKKIAQCKSGKNEDLQSFFEKARGIVSKTNGADKEAEFEDVDMNIFSEAKEKTNE